MAGKLMLANSDGIITDACCAYSQYSVKQFRQHQQKVDSIKWCTVSV